MYLQKPTGNILNGELLVAFSFMAGSTKNVHYSASTGNPTPRNRSGKRVIRIRKEENPVVTFWWYSCKNGKSKKTYKLQGLIIRVQ